MSGLPNGWQLTLLGEIGFVQSGVGFPNEYQGFTSGAYPVYKVGDVSRGVTQNKGKLQLANNYVSVEIAEFLKGHIFEPGSTLFAKIGEALKLNRRGFVLNPGLADNNVMGFKSVAGINDRFIYYFLLTQDFAEYSRSTTVPSIRKGDIEGIQIALPPAAEQTRIAVKLDELLAQVDTLKARIDGIPALLKRFRQSVLAAAVSGRLTKEWRNQQVSGDWASTTLGQLCKLKSGIAVSPDIEKQQGYFKYFKVGEMNHEGNEFFLQKTDRYLEKGDAPEKSLMPAGAIVFPKRGGAIATNKKRIMRDDSFVDLNVMGILVPEGVEVFYVYRWFETVDLAKLNTGSAIPQVNNTDIAPLNIPLPPLAEQTEIVHRVQQLFAFADQLEVRVKTAQTRIDRLTQSILAKAFCGELVPQDLNDEPASVLLERIKVQRAAAPKAKRGRRASA